MTEDGLPPEFEERSEFDSYDFTPVDFTPSALDYREPEPSRPEEDLGPNPNILRLAEEYLASANATLWVRRHMPLLLATFATKIADRRNLRHPIHWYNPSEPYRYLVNVTQLGASGHNKGATVSAFYRIVGAEGPDGPALAPTYRYKGGSIEAVRGGIFEVTTPVPAQLDRLGQLERMDDGFIHVPEFSQLVGLEARSPGAIQAILAWADDQVMTYDTLSGASVEYAAAATLIVDLQPDKLDDVEATVLGWNRRSVYDTFDPPTTEEMLPENRPPALPGDPARFHALRGAIRLLTRNYAPREIDWTDFRAWLSRAYRENLATIGDEPLLYSLALGYHLVSGGSWTGRIRVEVPEWVHHVLREAIWNKRRARVSRIVRAAEDAKTVLRDPYILGGEHGTARDRRTLVRIIASRLSIPEERVDAGIEALLKEGALVAVQSPEEPNATLYRRGFLTDDETPRRSNESYINPEVSGSSTERNGMGDAVRKRTR